MPIKIDPEGRFYIEASHHGEYRRIMAHPTRPGRLLAFCAQGRNRLILSEGVELAEARDLYQPLYPGDDFAKLLPEEYSKDHIKVGC